MVDVYVKHCIHHGDLTMVQCYQRNYTSKAGLPKVYLECQQCCITRSKIYRASKADDPRYQAMKVARDARGWVRRKAELQTKRQTPEYRAKVREWYKRNSSLVCPRVAAKNKQYRDDLHDTYIRKRIQDDDKTIKWGDIPQPLIRYKRTLIELKRRIKAIKKLNAAKYLQEQLTNDNSND